MANVRKRKLPSGLIRWQAGYVDGTGQRRSKMFKLKTDANAWLIETGHALAHGLHTPDSISPTVKAAGTLWLQRCQDKRLEPMTVKGYEEHCNLHIYPFIGTKKLSELTVPAVNAFADQLTAEGRSPEMVRRVIRSLGSIFRDARRRGHSNVDPTHGLKLDLPERDDPRPVIPTKAELQALVAVAAGRWRPLVLVGMFCGLRASELRGLRWSDVDFETREVKISQRADASHRIGKLKSKAAYRSIPCPPIVINTLREWRLQCPKGDLGLVFPNGSGKVESYANIIEHGFGPLQKAAGVVNENGGAKYGMHALRHACASLWIEQGHNPKQIQTLIGHSSIQVTYDVYGHLFADADGNQRAAEEIQLRLLGK
jgi:integrase